MMPVAFLFTMMVTMIIMKMRKNSMYDPRSCTFFHTIYHFLLTTTSLVVVVEQFQVNKILISIVDISIS